MQLQDGETRSALTHVRSRRARLCAVRCSTLTTARLFEVDGPPSSPGALRGGAGVIGQRLSLSQNPTN